MNAAISTSLLKLVAGLGLAFAVGHAVMARERAAELTPLTAIYRTNATPQWDSDLLTWRYTRHDPAVFARAELTVPEIGEANGSLLGLIARECSSGGTLQATTVVADAFERSFTLHVPAGPPSADGITEVWWSPELGLPLVIVREAEGRTIVDELVRLDINAHSEPLVSRDR